MSATGRPAVKKYRDHVAALRRASDPLPKLRGITDLDLAAELIAKYPNIAATVTRIAAGGGALAVALDFVTAGVQKGGGDAEQETRMLAYTRAMFVVARASRNARWN